MHQRVTAILVARNGADYLGRTLSALAAQTRRPDSLVVVDAGSSDDSSAMLASASPGQHVTVQGKPAFGAALAQALNSLPAAESDNEWLWLLAHDNAPAPNAFEALLGAVEVAPSVAIAGPKLMRRDEPDVIAEFGETMTPFGASLGLVTDELDQAQHDRRTDLLAVAAGGMLVRRSVWVALGGFDPALPSADAALDFSVRARLAGHRVIGVPSARVSSAGGPELFGRATISGIAAGRIRRAAQLHRRLVYAAPPALVVHWLSLLPLAVLRSIGHLVLKRPGVIPGEFATALAAAFRGGRVLAARRNLARNRVVGWSAIKPLRMPWPAVREHRAHERFQASAPAAEPTVRERPEFFAGGGAWIVLFAAIVGGIAYGAFAAAGAVSGGALLPLGGSLRELWSQIGYGWREIGAGFTGAADPFAVVLATLGSLSFWSPSLAIVGVYLVALPLAALGAWWCAARFTSHTSASAWAPNVAAVAWAFAPPLLAGLADGRIGAVLAHLLLPWLVLTAALAARSWAAAAASALLFAAIAASAPVLAPALLVLWLALLVTNPRGAHRVAWLPVPAAVLFAPLIIDQIVRGTPLALLADPGVPWPSTAPSGWELALGSPEAGFADWQAFLAVLGIPEGVAPIVAAALLVPLAGLVLVGLLFAPMRSTLPAVAIAVLGLGTALAAAHLELAHTGTQSVAIWTGSGLSLYWLGLLAAAAVGLAAVPRAVAAPGLVLAATSIVLAVPLLLALVPNVGTAAVAASSGRLLPAFVTAEAGENAELGTLLLAAQPDGSFTARLERGGGTTLDEQSTLASTATEIGDGEERVAALAANLSTESGFDPVDDLEALGIGFVVLGGADTPDAENAREEAEAALDSNSLFIPVGSTDSGLLWRYSDATAATPVAEEAGRPAWAMTIAIVQAVVFGATLLMAVPTVRRRRRHRTAEGEDAAPVDDDFDEDDRVA